MANNTCFLLFIFVFVAAFEENSSLQKTLPCALRPTKYGSVCVCNVTYCDYLSDVVPSELNGFLMVSSSSGGLRFSPKNGKFGFVDKFVVDDYKQYTNTPRSPQQTEFDPVALLFRDGKTFIELASRPISSSATRSVRLDIKREVRYQKIVGFGGAFTGSVSYIIDKMPQPLQDHFYESFFATHGIGFNLLRLSIGGSDFDLSPWAYNEFPENDFQLTNFSALDPRDELKIKQIKRLKDISKHEDVKLMAAAWSPPKWMKSNNKWTGFSHLKKEFYQSWADYHIRFLQLMDAKNMPIWAISTGNEPLNGVIGWFFVRFMSLGWTPRNQAIWLADNLGPTLRNSKYRDVLIFGNDDQRYSFPMWFNMMNSSRSNSLHYLNGLAVHWYWDDIFGPSLIDVTHKQYPEKLLLNTESCVGDKPWQTHGPELGSWGRGEKYARAFLQDLQHSFNGWIDWNIALDEHGGPNYVNNTVDAPVIVNQTNNQEFYKQPIFYAIGHFSKFIPEGSIRIEASRSNVNIDSVAFLRPDGSVCSVIINSGVASVDIKITDSLRGNIVVYIPPRSMHTILYN